MFNRHHYSQVTAAAAAPWHAVRVFVKAVLSGSRKHPPVAHMQQSNTCQLATEHSQEDMTQTLYLFECCPPGTLAVA
jgi:hypothetical protein